MIFCSPGILKVRLPPLLCTVPGVAPSKLSVMIPGLCSSALCCYLGIINISSCAEYLRVTTVCIKSAHKPHHYAKTSKSKMYWAIATWPLRKLLLQLKQLKWSSRLGITSVGRTDMPGAEDVQAQQKSVSYYWHHWATGHEWDHKDHCLSVPLLAGWHRMSFLVLGL